MDLVPDISSSLFATAGAAAVNITSAMASGKLYHYRCTIGSWIKQGTVAANPVATAGAGSMYVPPNCTILLSGGYGARLSILRDGGADGSATITRVDRMG